LNVAEDEADGADEAGSAVRKHRGSQVILHHRFLYKYLYTLATAKS
jgi:hypothetical protein